MKAAKAAAVSAAGVILLAAGWAPPAAGHDGARAHYLANEGLMVAHGETKVLFDPLFDEGFGQYELLPESMRQALFAGEPPWDGVDAVFISHYHDDHFSPTEMVRFLRVREEIHLYAPEQAALREAAGTAGSGLRVSRSPRSGLRAGRGGRPATGGSDSTASGPGSCRFPPDSAGR